MATRRRRTVDAERERGDRGRQGMAGGNTFSKVLSTVTSCRKHTRALTFENVWLGGILSILSPRVAVPPQEQVHAAAPSHWLTVSTPRRPGSPTRVFHTPRRLSKRYARTGADSLLFSPILDPTSQQCGAFASSNLLSMASPQMLEAQGCCSGSQKYST